MVAKLSGIFGHLFYLCPGFSSEFIYLFIYFLLTHTWDFLSVYQLMGSFIYLFI